MTRANEQHSADHYRRLKRLANLARLLDTAVRIPGTPIRFGADQVVGLVPGVGDATMGLVGLYVVNEARRLGLPRRKIARMLGNLGFDLVMGSVPLVGDALDIVFKAHRRNVLMILDHFGVPADGDFEIPYSGRSGDMKDVTPGRR